MEQANSTSLPQGTQNFFFDHAQSAVCQLDEGPLNGLRHRTVIDARGGAAALALWQEEHLPGFAVPLHSHDCEEIITVLEGHIEAVIGDRLIRVGPLQSILIPAGALHGFRVLEGAAMRLLAIFSSNDPKIFKANGEPSQPPWEGGASDHLGTEFGPNLHKVTP
jgi:quercetin dioxygenase-like cupin family protein